jgi:hypothetical protein
MNKLTRKITPILGVTGLAFAALTANAQVIQYNTGDLIVDFSKAGSSDLEVDIGSIAALTSEAQSAGGTYDLGGAGGPYDPSAQLLANFGSASGVTFTAFGVAGTGAPGSDDYLSLKRSNPGTQNTTPGDWTPSKGNNILAQINGITTGLTSYSGQIAADSVANTPSAVLVPSSSSQSPAYVDSYTYGKSGLTGYTGTSIGNTLSSSSVVSDLYDYAELGSGTKATYEGYFTFNSDGSLDFTTAFAPVPEPKTYGLAAGAGLLIFSLRNRLKSKNI